MSRKNIRKKPVKVLYYVIQVFLMLLIISGSLVIGYFYRDNLKPERNLEYEFPYSLAEMVARHHEYNLTSYNCVQYSNDLVSSLKSAGYESALVVGNVKTNETDYGHAWTCLFIEPQTGGPILTSKNYNPEYFVWNHKFYNLDENQAGASNEL